MKHIITPKDGERFTTREAEALREALETNDSTFFVWSREVTVQSVPDSPVQCAHCGTRYEETKCPACGSRKAAQPDISVPTQCRVEWHEE